jgi:hypothetical protein
MIFYDIKAVFVFDGGVPALKRQTIAKRRMAKSDQVCRMYGTGVLAWHVCFCLLFRKLIYNMLCVEF